MALFQARHYSFLATEVAPNFTWPDKIVELANKLESTNPKFNKVKFISVATKAWEDKNLNEDEIYDYIPQLHDLP